MKHKRILALSGGKDSTATGILLKNKGIEFTPVFNDTGWEHPETIRYLDYLNNVLFDGKIIKTQSKIYPNGMVDLVDKKGRVPSAKARFCTEALKIKPMIDFMNEPEQSEVKIIYRGIRREESKKRSTAKMREYADYFGCWMVNPILTWTSKEVFEFHEKNNIKPNPLYKKGAGRVGCFPCIMINHGELKRMQEFYPEIWYRIALLEEISKRSFFSPNYIPKRFQTGFDEKSKKSYPVSADVKKYMADTEDFGQLSFLKQTTCSSIYNLCE